MPVELQIIIFYILCGLNSFREGVMSGRNN